MTEARAAQFKSFVEAGGTLVLGCRSGYKDIYGRCPMMPMPGLLAPLTGCTVEDFTFLGPADEAEYMVWGNDCIPAPMFNDVLHPDTPDCTVLAVYKGNYYDGMPALTHRRVGQGEVYAFGAVFAEKTAAAFIDRLGLRSPVDWTLPEAVELTIRRQADGAQYAFLLNYTDQPQEIRVPQSVRSLLTGETVCGACTIEPYGVLVLEIPET